MGYGKNVWVFPDAELPPEGVNASRDMNLSLSPTQGAGCPCKNYVDLYRQGTSR